MSWPLHPLKELAELPEAGQCREGGRGGRKGAAAGLKAVCSGRVGRTPLQGHGGSKTRGAVLSLSAVPPAAAAPPSQALLEDVPPAVRLLPQPSPEGSRGALDVASAAQLYTTVLLLKHRAQQVRRWEQGAAGARSQRGGSSTGDAELSLVATGWGSATMAAGLGGLAEAMAPGGVVAAARTDGSSQLVFGSSVMSLAQCACASHCPWLGEARSDRLWL